MAEIYQLPEGGSGSGGGGIPLSIPIGGNNGGGRVPRVRREV